MGALTQKHIEGVGCLMVEITIKKFPKPISKRFCKCGEIVKAERFYLMGNGYQAFGFCKCGMSHAFDEFISIRWWDNQ